MQCFVAGDLRKELQTGVDQSRLSIDATKMRRSKRNQSLHFILESRQSGQSSSNNQASERVSDKTDTAVTHQSLLFDFAKLHRNDFLHFLRKSQTQFVDVFAAFAVVDTRTHEHCVFAVEEHQIVL